MSTFFGMYFTRRYSPLWDFQEIITRNICLNLCQSTFYLMRVIFPIHISIHISEEYKMRWDLSILQPYGLFSPDLKGAFLTHRLQESIRRWLWALCRVLFTSTVLLPLPWLHSRLNLLQPPQWRCSAAGVLPTWYGRDSDGMQMACLLSGTWMDCADFSCFVGCTCCCLRTDIVFYARRMANNTARMQDFFCATIKSIAAQLHIRSYWYTGQQGLCCNALSAHPGLPPTRQRGPVCQLVKYYLPFSMYIIPTTATSQLVMPAAMMRT